MIQFHAVMIDETGCEFGADVEAMDRSEAWELLYDRYPESRIDQLESPEDAAAREAAMYHHINRGGDWDEEGRPIFPGGEYDDWDDDWEEEENDYY